MIKTASHLDLSGLLDPYYFAELLLVDTIDVPALIFKLCAPDSLDSCSQAPIAPIPNAPCAF